MKKFIFCVLSASIMTGTLWAQVEPGAGKWKTWVISSAESYRLPAPPDDEITAEELRFVKDRISQRDQAAVASIHYWDAGSPGYRWMQFTQESAVSAGLPAPLQTRALALVAAAISDATVAAWDTKYTYNRPHPGELDSTITPVVTVPQSPSYPSEHAVTAGAAAAILEYLFPDQAAKVAAMAEEAATSRVIAGVAFPSDVFNGLELGKSVGRAVVAFAQRDGSGEPFDGSYPPARGLWSSNTPATPLAGSWKPWVLNSAGEFRPDPPPAFGSDDANEQYAAVKSLNRTNLTNHLVWFWQPGFFQPWLEQVDLEIFQNHFDLNPPRAARVYAYETIAQHDATLACWDTKYSYLEPRPSQADPTISPVLANPQHPGYPSGHACASGASAAIMSALFPDDTRLFTSMASDAGNSTFDAGIHTQLDVRDGLKLGTQVGQKIAARALADGAN
jgi:membrane-associated phospholipid phosphatase